MNKNALDAEQSLATNTKNGLSTNEANDRLKKYGFNQLEVKKKQNFFIKYLSQFKDPMLVLLLIAAVVSFVFAALPKEGIFTHVEEIIEWVEPSIIILIVFINTMFGAIQEVKSEKAMDSLKNMTTPIAKVIRNGEFSQIKSTELVPGDILILEAGDNIPADGIIVESSTFKVIESVLTGESLPIEKNDEFEYNESTSMADKLNCVYSGTSVINGRAKVLVTATGMNSEIGKIAKILNNEKDIASPLEKRMIKVGKILSIAAAFCAILVFLIYIFYTNNIVDIKNTWINGFKIALSIGIAVVPEGLLAVLTIVLAIGIKRMIKFNAIIKKTSSVETLGSASVICSDKTGTLTQNKMTVIEIFCDNKIFNKDNFVESQKIIEYGMLCNDSKLDGQQIVGDPTETSIVKLGQELEIDFEKLNQKYKRVDELPFDSDRKLMTTINQISNQEYLVITKGAPDNLFKICKNDTNLYDKNNEIMGKKALRVLAIAVKKIRSLPKEITPTIIEKDLELVGLFGIIDPPREEVKETIKTCLNAGIRPIMITGDHVNTANAIASQLGILSNNQETATGIEIAKMSDEELQKNVPKYSVYARVSPEDKIRVVKAWQANGQIVAMTGDGVNDAPALKAADIGCAMGITGTEVSKNAADMILMDDNFNTIVHAIHQGRGILDNIKRIMITLFTTNLVDLLSIILGMLIFSFSPFTAIQMLWVNLITESFPGIALGMKKPQKNVMNFSPNESKNLLDAKVIFRIVSQSLIFLALILLAFFLGAGSAVNYNFNDIVKVFKIYESSLINSEQREAIFLMQMRGSTLAFIVLAVSQSFNAFNTFSNRNIFTYKWSDIKYLIIAFSISFGSICFVLFIPNVNDIFNSDIYNFSDLNKSVDVLINNNFSVKITLSDSGFLVPIAFIMAFIPTIIFELIKLVTNTHKFSEFSKKNKFLNLIV